VLEPPLDNMLVPPLDTVLEPPLETTLAPPLDTPPVLPGTKLDPPEAGELDAPPLPPAPAVPLPLLFEQPATKATARAQSNVLVRPGTLSRLRLLSLVRDSFVPRCSPWAMGVE
jgi:hypothetical protein